jgi:hypothetical protein
LRVFSLAWTKCSIFVANRRLALLEHAEPNTPKFRSELHSNIGHRS